jgi:hypothetical protein
MIRRRQAAARRLPRLASGYSDPLLEGQRRQMSKASANAAWAHLRSLGLMDDDGYQLGILASTLEPDQL